ncbi:MAG TPA: hypothetical protein VN892_04720, partial [Solirubrobacteraceae bacterium]|nr:hypothetical protein [Solirubrobacteraceae bacterium]
RPASSSSYTAEQRHSTHRPNQQAASRTKGAPDMQQPKTAGAAITAILTLTALLSALTATTAAAAQPEFLPGTAGTKFTSKSGSRKLEAEGAPTIECKEGEDEGVLLSSTESLVTIDFLGCKILGLVGAHSLGDKTEVILVHGNLLLCYINKEKSEIGAALHIQPVHLEAAKELILIEGIAIGKITPYKSKKLAFLISWKSSGSTQEVKKCEGSTTEETLTSKTNGGTAVKAGENTEDTIGFLVTEQEIME